MKTRKTSDHRKDAKSAKERLLSLRETKEPPSLKLLRVKMKPDYIKTNLTRRDAEKNKKI